jgi:hypothetical protein
MRYEKEVWYCFTIIVIIIGIVTFPSDQFAGVVVIIIGFIFICFIRKSERAARVKGK